MTSPTNQQAGAARPDDAAPGLGRKSFEVELKSAGDDGTFEMYGAAFNNVDRGGDLIPPGAVANVDEFVRAGWIALNHRASDLPMGFPESASQDDRGFRVRGKFHSTPEAQQCRTVVRERLAAGKAVLCSIGYVIEEAAQEVRDGEPVRVLKRIRIYEVSFVNLPMNPAAEVVSAKSHPTETAVPTNPNAADGGEAGILAGLKRLLGLETKAGAAISKANREKLRGVADAMEEHHKGGLEKCMEMHKCVKAMKAHHEEGAKIAESVRDFADSHEPDVDDEDDPPRRRREKDDEPRDTDDASPPKGLSREQIAVKLAALRRD
jgi:HK97 family phage prohead protease